MDKATFRRARERALYILEGRDCSYTELYEKLSKNYDDGICLAVCDNMVELSLIDDRRYAEKLARHYITVKKYGMYRAKQEMTRKGIPPEMAEEFLEEYEEDTIERITELIEKKYARYLNDEKGIRKVKSALVRMGYSYGDINAVLEEYENEW